MSKTLPEPAPLPDVTYKILLSRGPLVMVRLRLTGKQGRKRYTARWRDIVKAAGAVLREHGLRAKDLLAIDHVIGPDDWDPDPAGFWYRQEALWAPEHLAEALGADGAFAGTNAAYRAFWLYDWVDGGFVLVRRPVTA